MGADEMIMALQNMPERIAKKRIRPALREAAKVIRAELVQNAPVDTGLTRRAIRIGRWKRKRNLLSIAVSIGAKDYAGQTFYAAMVNYGWKVGKRPTGGKAAFLNDRRKKIPGTRWMNISFDTAKDLALQVFNYKLQQGIEEEARTSEALK
jgi:HK97 gp10 family phage protein